MNFLRLLVFLVLKRILAQKWLALAALVGLVVTLAIVMSIPIYTDAVYYQSFQETMNTPPDANTLPRPPFSFMFRYGDGLNDPVQLEDVQAVDTYLTNDAPTELGLPLELTLRHFRTQDYPLYPEGATVTSTGEESLGSFNLSSVSELEDHITLVSGRYPAASSDADSPAGVLVSLPMATELELHVGDSFFVYIRYRDVDDIWVSQTLPVRIDGIWTPTEPGDSYWFIRPDVFDDHLMIPEETFIQRISPLVPDEVYGVVWYLVLKGDAVTHSNVGPLIDQINRVQQRASVLLPGLKLMVSPRDQLTTYLREANVLNALLFAFGVPVIGLMLMFIVLTRTLAMEQQRNEIAVLRSRGALRLQIVGVALLEEIVIGIVALLLAIPLSLWLASVIGQARSFLVFGAPREMRLLFSPAALDAGLAILGVTLLAQILPTLRASGHTVLTYKHERARWQQRPLWQRLWLDVLLLIPVLYGAYLLQQQGSLAVLDNDVSRNLFENPLLFLVPALGILALALFSLRLIPLVLGALAWILARTRNVSLLMAVRQLARTPGLYTTPLLLLVLTLSLSAFTASMAQTLDQHLRDQSYYQVGADLAFPDFGESPSVEPAPDAGPSWVFRPVTDYVEMMQADAATRVGIYEATTSINGQAMDGTFVGVDRFDLPGIAFWRNDFAPESLGGLMNTLALNPDGILLPRAVMDDAALQVGDTLRVIIEAYHYRTALDLRIIGAFDLFPLYIPTEGPVLVGNLNYFFEQAGAPFPYQVWMRTNDQTAPSATTNPRTPERLIEAGQQRPERQGLFGILSVGFLAAAALTVIGFAMYMMFSFRQRFIQIGVLRAVGLLRRQMIGLLAWEMVFLVLCGGIIGTLLGVWSSAFFIPYLQVDTGPLTGIPPMIVEVAWPAILRIYLLFAGLFLLGLSGSTLLLRRMKIFQAIKLGETA
ncbi:MAG: ABC transporter permease [Anaerolineae bacterium]|nr:ABC transporter permease [Anaerolineae bacterium]